MKHVNLNALRVFAVVARHGNLQNAADELNISRGAVSQRIKQLEIDLGVALLVREARGVSLTVAGKRCRAAVDTALATIETAFIDIGAVHNQIVLHLGPSTMTKWLMPRIDRFAASFPNISLQTEVHETRLPRSLGRNEIAIWPGRMPDANPGHECIPLTAIRLVAVCSPQLVGDNRPNSLEPLLQFPLLQDAHRHWERLIASNVYFASNRLLNFNRSALALDAAIRGHGVAIAPTYMVEHDLRAQQLVTVWSDQNPVPDQLFASWSRDHIAQQVTRRIVDWFVSEFAQPAHANT